MGRNIYIELTNTCTHSCDTCPHGREQQAGKSFFTPLEEIVSRIKETGAEYVTLSGGEPMMHPQIMEIIDTLAKMNVRITLLSNLYLLEKKDLADRLVPYAKVLTIVTALHSAEPSAHDAITNTPGSFEAQCSSIDALVKRRMNVIIKVILSLHTCERLDDILTLVQNRWGKYIRFNLCGMDLCGADEAAVRSTPVDFQKEGELLEEFLDRAEKWYWSDLKFFVSISEYPLCHVDPYYWNLFSKGVYGNTVYVQDGLARFSKTLRTESTCAPHASACRECMVSSLCPGFWHSIYRIYGESAVTPVKGG